MSMHALVNLNDKLRAASGDVYLRRPEIHREQNANNYIVERIVVELK